MNCFPGTLSIMASASLFSKRNTKEPWRGKPPPHVLWNPAISVGCVKRRAIQAALKGSLIFPT